MLHCAKLLLFRRVPTDRCGIKNNFCPVQRRQARRFRVPLVPANTDSNLAACCWPRLKSEIAWCEIKFIVIQRVVRDMHFPVLAKKFALGVSYGPTVVIVIGPR